MTVPSQLQKRCQHLVVAMEDSRSSASGMDLILPSAVIQMGWGG